MRAVLLAALLLVLFVPSGTAHAVGEEEDITVEEGVSEIMEQVDVSDWDEWFFQQPEQIRELWDGVPPSAYLDSLVWEGDKAAFETDGLLNALTGSLYSLLPSALLLLSAYVGFAIFGGITKGLEGSSSLFSTTQTVFCAAVGCFCTAQLWTLIEECKGTLLGLSSLIEVLMPTLLALLLLFGAGGSAAVMQPASALLSGSIIGIIVKAVMPLAMIGGIVGIMDMLFGKERFAGFGKLINRLCKWAVTGCSALYLIFTTVRGMAANASDSVLLKTGKFAASSLPFVGRLVADSMDTAYGCMVLVKNAVGITGIMLGLYWVIRPLLLLAVNILVLRLSAALCAPIMDGAYPKTLSVIADMLSVLLGSIVAAMMMFIVTVGLVSGLGGGT
ncbi:MAG: hypothetical protein Q4C01_01730 [Clostridia bacterium]|nr:hypothetical protein [Clostridia bacterium]